MLLIVGEVRKIVTQPYTDKKTGKSVNQAVLVLEPANSRHNYEVFLTNKQLAACALWEKLKGKQAAVMVNLYVNHEFHFHKFTAVGDAKPLLAPELELFSGV